MEIRIRKIKMQNFKAIHCKEIDLDGKDAVISGANGSGKTTIYEAYYWCLFGKTFGANGIVQTLDENNEVIHKVDTVVELVLDINGEYDVTIRRNLTEDWKAKNTPDEHLNGTKVQRFWNEVPISKAEYQKKLTALIPMGQWQLLSNNFSFMGFKMEDRRKMLLSIVGEVDEAKLQAPFPAIQKAVKERKTIDELNAQYKNTRKSSNKELLEIPAKIDAQDALKVKTDKKEGEEDAHNIEEYFKAVDEAQKAVDEYKRSWGQSHEKKLSSLRQTKYSLEEKVSKAKSDRDKNKEEQDKRIKKLTAANTAFETAKAEWLRINAEDFDFKQSDKCPVCGQTLPEAFKREEKAKAVEEFNKNKSERLKAKMDEAQQASQQKTVLKGSVDAYNQIQKVSDDKAVSDAEKELENATKQYDDEQKLTVEGNNGYKKLLKQLEDLQKAKPANADDVVKLKADQEINKRVEKEKKRLQERSAELTQIIADCDNVLNQIFNYKKAKIDAVEDKVNGYFDIVKWKFFQQNVTNDDLQEICTCLINGVDYNNLNTASKVNASVDIVNGISKAAQICVPCWVDGRESITELIPSVGQQISLKVVDNAPLTVATK